MATEVKLLATKVSLEYYAKVKETADASEKSIAAFLRMAVDEKINGDKPEINGQDEKLLEQLKAKDEQIDHLQQIVAMAQQNVDKLSVTLGKLTDQNQFLLEDKRKSWFRRLLSKS